MSDYVKMSRQTFGVMLAQNKITFEEISAIGYNGNPKLLKDKILNRKALYAGKEIIFDDSTGFMYIAAADALKIGDENFKPKEKRVVLPYDPKPEKDEKTKNLLKREIIF